MTTIMSFINQVSISLLVTVVFILMGIVTMRWLSPLKVNIRKLKRITFVVVISTAFLSSLTFSEMGEANVKESQSGKSSRIRKGNTIDSAPVEVSLPTVQQEPIPTRDSLSG